MIPGERLLFLLIHIPGYASILGKFNSLFGDDSIMSKVCELTGKRPAPGYKYAIRGIAKKKKGIGLKVTGKTRRRFQPNLQTKRLWVPAEGRWITIKLSCSAMRTIDKLGIDAVLRKKAAGICI